VPFAPLSASDSSTGGGGSPRLNTSPSGNTHATSAIRNNTHTKKQETVSGSGISWASSRRTTMPVPHHSVFNRPDALPATQPTASKALKAKISQLEQFTPHPAKPLPLEKKPKPLTRSSLLLINFIHCTWQNFTSNTLNDSLYLIDDHSQLN